MRACREHADSLTKAESPAPSQAPQRLDLHRATSRRSPTQIDGSVPSLPNVAGLSCVGRAQRGPRLLQPVVGQLGKCGLSLSGCDPRSSSDRLDAQGHAAHRDRSCQLDTKLDTTSPPRHHVSSRARPRRHELSASHASPLPRYNLPHRGTGNAPQALPRRRRPGARGLSGPARRPRKPDPRPPAGLRDRNNRWRFKPGSPGARHDLSRLAFRDAPRTRQRSGLDRSSQLACPNPQKVLQAER
jgi:hypothetical protein